MLSRFAALFISAQSAAACDLALVLAVDVSGSVDHGEFRIQMDGLSAALRDGIVAEALVTQQARVTLVQWTGSSRQRQTIPWTVIDGFDAVDRFAAAIETDPRAWRSFSTAVGEALELSLDLLEGQPECRRKVVDVSGDGPSNEGPRPAEFHTRADALGVVVNGLAIEVDETDLTAWYFENLIFGEGAFVETAQGFEDYPAAIRRKLQRETLRAVTMLD